MDQDYLSSLPYDVLYQVCASASSDRDFRAPLDGLSRSTKHLRDISLSDVFRNVFIRGSWDFASSRLKAMEECHAILSCVKVLKLDIYEENGATPPPKSMPSELANLLSAMSHLEKLVFVVPEYHSGLFEEAFRHAELMMPSVDILVVELLKVMPNIASMGMDGGDYDVPLEELLPTLSRFQHLQKLALAGAHALNVGFDPPRCGNVYMGPRGAAVRQEVEREEEEVERKVTHMIFPVCARLEELWIGDTRKAVAERSPDGSLKNITMSECDRDKIVKPHYP